MGSHLKDSEEHEYLSKAHPVFANFRFCIQKELKPKEVMEEELDFKTKASLKGQLCQI
jgi:hypothetical protein